MKHIMNEKLPISNLTPLKARWFDYQHFTYPWHFHSEFEIIWIQSGTGTRFIGNSIEKFMPGEVLIIGSNLPHYLKSDAVYHAENSELRVTGIIIQFEKDFMQHSIQHYPQFLRIKNVLEEAKTGICYQSTSELEALLSKLTNENGIDQITTFLQLLKKMTEIKVRRKISTPDFEYNTHQGASRMDKIITFINKNYTRQIPLEEIASFSAMNASAFCRYFKKETGKTLIQFVYDMRIDYACKLLLMNDMNVSQISVVCGFETISHFNKIFRKITGYAPLSYRKIMLTD